MNLDPRNLQRVLEQMERRCVDRYNQLVSHHNSFAAQIVNSIRQQRTGSPTQLDYQRSLHAAITEEARKYTNLIMVVGYAGIFGLWQMVRSALTSHSDAIVGISIGLSIMLFALFEVYKMIDGSILAHQLEKLLRNETDFSDLERLQAWGKYTEESKRRIARSWIWFLIPTVVTGFGAGIYLIFILMSSLWN